MDNIIVNISNILAGISIVLGIEYALRSYFSRKKQEKITNEIKFKKILESDNIESLGKYLEKDLGKITINEFINNENVNRNINTFLEKLKKYTALDREVKTESERNEIKTTSDDLLRKIEDENRKMNKEAKALTEKLKSSDIKFEKEISKLQEGMISIWRELENGETWNSLAKLRRLIEMQLRDYISEKGLNVDSRVPINKLLSIFGEINKENIEYIKALKYVISICNRAIHGFDISFEEARKVIRESEYILKKIDIHES